jgi:hypothetical protein
VLGHTHSTNSRTRKSSCSSSTILIPGVSRVVNTLTSHSLAPRVDNTHVSQLPGRRSMPTMRAFCRHPLFTLCTRQRISQYPVSIVRFIPTFPISFVLIISSIFNPAPAVVVRPRHPRLHKRHIYVLSSLVSMSRIVLMSLPFYHGCGHH